LNLDFVRRLKFEPITQNYDARDSALYALSLGMGEDPLDEDELLYVYEGRGPLAVPSQCVTLCWQPFWHNEPAAEIIWPRVLHGEQSFKMHRPLPAAGSVRGECSVASVVDQGASRGVIAYFSNEISHVKAAPASDRRISPARASNSLEAGFADGRRRFVWLSTSGIAR
jgi:hypothetical protein